MSAIIISAMMATELRNKVGGIPDSSTKFCGQPFSQIFSVMKEYSRIPILETWKFPHNISLS